MRALIVAPLILAGACVPPGGAATCHSEVDRLWPAPARAAAHRIVQRESHGLAGAQNRRSSAAGCLQLLRVHAPRFRKLGYSWSDRYNPTANVRVGLDLWREQGWRPWRLA